MGLLSTIEQVTQLELQKEPWTVLHPSPIPTHEWQQIQSFIWIIQHSSNKYLHSIYYVPSTMLDTGGAHIHKKASEGFRVFHLKIHRVAYLFKDC